MADHKGRAVIADVSGGRNGVDAPTSPRFRENQCLDAVNVEWWQTDFARKRNGISALGMTGATMSGKVSAMHRHIPATDDTAAELWANDDAATPLINRLAGGATWAAPTIKDAPTGNGWDFSYASLNGLLFIGYQSAQPRLHCWDGSTVRRAGLAAPTGGAASPGNTGITGIANTAGVGTYAAIARFYRIRYTTQASAITVRRSEPGVATISVTPDGAHTGLTITISTAPGEGETHWEIEGSTDGVTFYRLATTVIGTTTYTDTAATSTYASNPLSALTGTYTAQKSYRFVRSDQGRLLGYGSWTSTDKQNDVEVSGAVGSLNIGDAERVDTTFTYRYSLDELDSGQPTGLQGPIFGNFYAFKSRQIWELGPTGLISDPYRKTAVSKTLGCVQGPASCLGEDANGNPAIYVMTHRGVYRIGVGGYEAGTSQYSAGGLQYVGHGIEDYILGPTATINLSATKVIAHLRWYPDKRQVWAFWATGSSNDPNNAAFYDVGKGGWSRVATGDVLANVRCSVLFSNSVGAAMSRDLRPYVGSATVNKTIYKGDDATKTDDAGTTFQAYVDLRAFEPGGPGFYGEVGDAEVFAQTATGVTITATVTPDFDATLTVSGSALLTAIGSETRRTVRCEGSGLNGSAFVQLRLGDSAAVSNGWTVDRVILPYEKRAGRTA